MVAQSIIDYAAEQIKRSQMAAFSCRYKKYETGADSATSEAGSNRLVKGSISPTRPKNWLDGAIFANLQPNQCRLKELPIYIDKTPDFARDSRGAGRYTIVGYREWSNEYRIRTEVHALQKPKPPENIGERVTALLSTRGARKIAESCEFMGLQRGGYTTFLTLTLDEAARARVACGETSIQREVSRFFDGLQKMYQRGFDCSVNGKPARFTGAHDKLDYLWVAESPDTIDGETGEVMGINPHVHVLMRYRVPFKLFTAWSERIEALWGQGFAHLEKIKDGSKAGAYMAKAAGYLCKAQGKSDQGIISGNRYNISKSARAPDWICVGRYELGKMGFLLSEASEHFDEKFGHIKKKRDHLKGKLQFSNGPDRQKIGAILEKTRSQLKRMPRLSKYQAILKGEDQYHQFLSWAKNNCEVSGHAWLPDKDPGDGFIENKGRSQWLNEYKFRKANRKEKRKWGSWFADHDPYMTAAFADMRLGRMHITEDEEDSISDYWEYAEDEARTCVNNCTEMIRN